MNRLKNSRPNILLVMTDQQSATMMSCAGNPYVSTPAMDYLALGGVRFERAYCTNPVCGPARVSLMTGQMPSMFGFRDNFDCETSSSVGHLIDFRWGEVMRDAGYEAAYGGKTHLPKGMSPAEMGFDYICADERDELAATCARYVSTIRDRPFFLVVSFINPHDICHMAIEAYLSAQQEARQEEHRGIELVTLGRALAAPDGVDEPTFIAEHCPPLPDNFEPQEDEPEAIRGLVEQRPFRKYVREHWTEREWRRHRWAYCRLTEYADAQVKVLLDALRSSGRADDTVVLFASDHGDMDGSHRMEHKTAFYEEAVRVPLIVHPPGAETDSRVDATHLVSTGLDLLPTVCDYAGIKPPSDIPGRSIRPLVEGSHEGPWRSCLAVESELGRMLVTDRYKYMLFDEGENREQMFDRLNDPGEMRNCAEHRQTSHVLEKHRGLFRNAF